MGKLTGKVAVVTGGNSGIGFAAALAFKHEGAKIVIAGRDPETLERARKELGDTTLAVQADVSKLADLDRLVAQTKERFGKVDVLFVNAGIAKFAPVEAMTEEIFDQTFDINVKGAFFTVQKALPILADGASVILTTSVVDEKGWANTSVYASSKAALRSLARTLSGELIGRGIRVNAIAPGPIETPIYGRMGLSKDEVAGFKGGIAQTNPMKRFGTSEEVAKAAVFLATNDSSYVLGVEINVDGGAGQL